MYLQIPVRGTFAAFLIHLPNTLQVENDLRSGFREVSLVPPEMRLVLQARCTRLGIKSPAILAMRLKMLVDLTKDQLYVVSG